MWDLPGPGLEPMSPALAGGLPTTAPPGKPHEGRFYTDSSLESGGTPHRAMRGSPKASPEAASMGKCGQEPLLWFPQEGAGKAGNGVGTGRFE